MESTEKETTTFPSMESETKLTPCSPLAGTHFHAVALMARAAEHTSHAEQRNSSSLPLVCLTFGLSGLGHLVSDIAAVEREQHTEQIVQGLLR